MSLGSSLGVSVRMVLGGSALRVGFKQCITAKSRLPIMHILQVESCLLGGCALDGFNLTLLHGFIHDLILLGLALKSASLIEALLL